MTVNQPMREDWTGDTGLQWVQHQRLFDRMLEPLGDVLLAAVVVEPGQRVLDIGCGTGTSTAALARRTTHAVGVDISQTMIDAARDAVPDARFFVADAQSDDLHGPYDALVSRFGVMFFDDPVAAFGNLGGATRANGTLTFICWRGLQENPIFTVGPAALNAALPVPPPLREPLAPGPLAFADPARVRGILVDSGWVAIDIDAVDTTCRFGVDGGDGVEERLVQLMASEAGRRFRQTVPPGLRGPGMEAARAQLREHVRNGELELAAAAWLVRARR